jgi:hypothetical protein
MENTPYGTDTKLGLLDASNGAPRTANAMLMEFTVKPSGIGNEANVVWDISRNMERKTWVTNGGIRTAEPSISFNTFLDNPNDDSRSTDEDNLPKNNHIYVYDSPGRPSNTANADRAEGRWNFNEFVRVKFDGKPFVDQNGTNAVPAVKGSRASPAVAWRSRMDVVRGADGKWQRNNTPGENEIELGHKALGN